MPTVTTWNITKRVAPVTSASSETGQATAPDPVDELGGAGGLPNESPVADAIGYAVPRSDYAFVPGSPARPNDFQGPRMTTLAPWRYRTGERLIDSQNHKHRQR